ncbi:hypothetical protein HMPREF9141_2162 [Prevotella multiformis DSM 16608]|uniref:Uncharacterized protein n=1 Tax=Prevotella multiformis DSM 16608 TaxID=888743 RepID=F0F995_9BACT|nr:hypothetical protein HMPREF9141_2162 [Prevotella multiformis DSM 16608]
MRACRRTGGGTGYTLRPHTGSLRTGRREQEYQPLGTGVPAAGNRSSGRRVRLEACRQPVSGIRGKTDNRQKTNSEHNIFS